MAAEKKNAKVSAKKAGENINSRIQLVMKSGKYTLGYKTTLKSLRSGKSKIVLLSSNLLPVRKSEVRLFVHFVFFMSTRGRIDRIRRRIDGVGAAFPFIRCYLSFSRCVAVNWYYWIYEGVCIVDNRAIHPLKWTDRQDPPPPPLFSPPDRVLRHAFPLRCASLRWQQRGPRYRLR